MLAGKARSRGSAHCRFSYWVVGSIAHAYIGELNARACTGHV